MSNYIYRFTDEELEDMRLEEDFRLLNEAQDEEYIDSLYADPIPYGYED